MSDILIIEDNADIARGLRDNLEVEGYEVDVAGDGEVGLARIRGRPPKLVILDLMLPRLDGIQVLRRLRDEGFEMPVLILSARAGEAEKVRGFRVGADDYVTKPFGLRELLARVDALFRRKRRLSSETEHDRSTPPARFGDVEIHFGSRTVLKHGAPVLLRPREFDLLAALARQANTVVARRSLLDEVWAYDDGVQTRTVDTHVVELRRKIENDPAQPRYIVTVRKAGYMLRVGTDG
ncbi:MAG TPA: response regulator transcription factor [Gemmatimonadaceae bacterium]|nr:response regulator transcription factor [Gemmatimonadaceae bacterium]